MKTSNARATSGLRRATATPTKFINMLKWPVATSCALSLRDSCPPAALRISSQDLVGVVYAKQPFTGPEQVLRYLSRYTHRVAISNRRLVSSDDRAVVFKWKDYRIEGPGRYKTMTLDTHEFHRIRHYALLASGNRAANIGAGAP